MKKLRLSGVLLKMNVPHSADYCHKLMGARQVKKTAASSEIGRIYHVESFPLNAIIQIGNTHAQIHLITGRLQHQAP